MKFQKLSSYDVLRIGYFYFLSLKYTGALQIFARVASGKKSKFYGYTIVAWTAFHYGFTVETLHRQSTIDYISSFFSVFPLEVQNQQFLNAFMTTNLICNLILDWLNIYFKDYISLHEIRDISLKKNKNIVFYLLLNLSTLYYRI